MLLQISLSLHLLAAVVWVGETVFDALVLGPVARAAAGRPWVHELQELLRPRLRWTSWLPLGVLVATGLWNLQLMHVPLRPAPFWATHTGRLLLGKLAGAAVLLALVGLHSLVQVPRARGLRLRAVHAVPAEAAAAWRAYAAARRRSAVAGRVITALATAVVLAGAWLVASGGHG